MQEFENVGDEGLFTNYTDKDILGKTMGWI